MNVSLQEQYVRLCRELIELQTVPCERREFEVLSKLDELWYNLMTQEDKEYARTVLDPEIRDYQKRVRNIG